MVERGRAVCKSLISVSSQVSSPKAQVSSQVKGSTNKRVKFANELDTEEGKRNPFRIA